MGFFDALLGRREPRKPDLDALFALPVAALGIEAETGFRPAGIGAVAYRVAEGEAFRRTHGEVRSLLTFGGADVEETVDSFGYTWMTCRADASDIEGLVTALHGANSTISAAGFGPQLLCSLVTFDGEVDGTPRRLGVVYLFKRGTFYPFAPTGPDKRDNALELRLQAALDRELPIEADLSKWFPLWGAPGL